MAISDARILDYIKQWSTTVVVDGVTQRIDNVLPSRSQGLEQPRSTCTIPVIDLPTADSGAAVTADVTLNGESTRFFTGTVADKILSSEPSYEITLYDALGGINKDIGTQFTWNNTAYATAVRQVLNSLGISDPEISSIHEPGSDYVLGPNYAIDVEENENGRNLLDKLMAFGGCALLVTFDGLVEVIDFPGWPQDAGSITRTYAGSAPDRSAGEFGFDRQGPPRRTIGGNEDVIRSYTAIGPRRPDLTIPDATFTLSGVSEGQSRTETYDYIQTTATASAIAEREIVRQNRQSTEVEGVVPLHPELRPGDSVLFRDSRIGFATATPALILSIQTNDDAMTMLLSVGAQPAEGELTIIEPPNADFTMQFEQQPITLTGVTATRTVVQFTDASTDPGGFTITSRSWTFACDGSDAPTPASSSEQNPLVIYPTLSGATATLTVEASSGEGDIETKAVVPGTGEAFTRALALAAGSDGWWVLAGSTGWTTFAGNFTAVPPINDNGPLFGGTSGGDVYETTDLLATPPTLVNSFASSIGCIWVDESNPQIILVASGTALHRSVDGGGSWALINTFGSTINWCETAVGSSTVLRVCAGDTEWYTTDGSSFSALVTGVMGSTAEKVASAPWGHLVVFSGTSAVADAWAFEEAGYTIDWSGVAPANTPTELTSVTPLQYINGYVVSDGTNDSIRDGLFGQLIYIATGATGARFWLISETSTGNFEASYITEATAIQGALKLVTTNAAFQIATPSTVYRIGYGQAINPAEPPQLVLLPTSDSTEQTLQHYIPVSGWAAKTLPVTDVDWTGIIVNPNNYAEWIIWHDTQAFHSIDSGANWTQIYHPTNALFQFGVIQRWAIQDIAWTGVGANWCMSIVYYARTGASGDTMTYIAFGAGSINQAQYSNGAFIVPPEPDPADPFVLPAVLVRGFDGELAGYASVSKNGDEAAAATSVCWLSSASPQPTVVGVDEYIPAQLRDPAVDREMLYSWSSNVGGSANYKTTLASGVIAGGGSVAVCQAGIFCGNRTGIAQINDFDINPSLSIVAASSVDVGAIVAGSQRRGCAARATAGVGGVYTVYALNADGQWTTADTVAGFTPVDVLGMPEP